MAEITRVPLQPIATGSISKMWLGIAVAALLAAALAWVAMPVGLTLNVLTAGTGATPQEDDVVFVEYVGKLQDGTEFDRSQPSGFPIEGVLPAGTPMALDGVIPGFREGLLQMQKGGSYELYIPADKAYGANPPAGSPIPPNSDLVFEVEVMDILTREETEQRFQVAQQMMQQMMQSGPEGPAGGVGPPLPGQAPPVPGQ